MIRQLSKILIILNFIFFSNSFAQPPSIQWSKCFGGSDNDRAHDVLQTEDGGFLIAGETISTNGDVTGIHDDFGAMYDLWLIKLDSLGTLQWQKCLGGSIDEGAFSISNAQDGGFIICGYASSEDYDVIGNTGFDDDYWVVKTNSLGAIQWQKCFGGSNFDEPCKIIQTQDSGYIVAGYALSTDGDVTGNHGHDYWIVKIDSVGGLQWEKSLGGWSPEYASSVIQKTDGNFIVAGGAFSNDNDVSGNHGAEDIWLVELNQTGDLVSQKCFGGSNSDGPSCMIHDNNGGFYISGGTLSNDGDVMGYHGGGDIFWMHIDSLWDIVSQKCIGGIDVENSSSMILSHEGNIIFVGESEEPNDTLLICNHGFYDGLIVSLDTSGNVVWNMCLGGSADDVFTSVKETRDGGFIICGYTDSNDGDVSGNHSGLDDFWVVKLAPLPDGISTPQNPITDFSLYQNQNNQTIDVSFYANGNEKINLQLFDITGRVLYEQAINATSGFNKQQLQTQNLGTGVYLVQLQSDGGAVTKKLVVH